MDPTYLRAYLCRTEAQVELKQYREALRDLTTVIHLKPDEPSYHLMKVSCAIHTYIHTCMCVYKYIHTHTYIRTCTHTYMHIYTRTHTYIHAYVCVYVCKCSYTSYTLYRYILHAIGVYTVSCLYVCTYMLMYVCTALYVSTLLHYRVMYI